MSLTDRQINRQDFVDNSIFKLMHELAPESSVLQWDIEIIGQIRDSVEDILVERLKLMTEMEFYAYV